MSPAYRVLLSLRVGAVFLVVEVPRRRLIGGSLHVNGNQGCNTPRVCRFQGQAHCRRAMRDAAFRVGQAQRLFRKAV